MASYANESSNENTAFANQNRPELRTSEFGERLEYEGAVCQDMFCAIAFWIHVALIIGLSVFFFLSKGDTIKVNVQTTGGVAAPISSIVAACVVGLVFGFGWLSAMQSCGGGIIKTMLFVSIASWFAAAVVGLTVGNMGLAIIGLIFGLLTGLYAWCIWDRIPFSAALLKIASTIVKMYKGTVAVQFTTVVLTMIWVTVWMVATYGYYESNNRKVGSGAMFLLFISLYWGEEVWRNVGHTTNCGVAATWYFSDPRNVGSPTCPAFKRTMTTSFGSVCFGSLVVAVLQALRAVLRSSGNQDGILACILDCILGCIESIIRYLNTYAYAQCAIYGTSFIESSKRTWDLFERRAIQAIINDDLTGMALFAGSALAFLVSGFCAFGFAHYVFGVKDKMDVTIGIIGAIIGFFVCFQVMFVVSSAIVTLFVCFSEDPEALFQLHQMEYSELTGARPELEGIRQSGTIANV